LLPPGLRCVPSLGGGLGHLAVYKRFVKPAAGLVCGPPGWPHVAASGSTTETPLRIRSSRFRASGPLRLCHEAPRETARPRRTDRAFGLPWADLVSVPVGLVAAAAITVYGRYAPDCAMVSRSVSPATHARRSLHQRCTRGLARPWSHRHRSVLQSACADRRRVRIYGRIGCLWPWLV